MKIYLASFSLWLCLLSISHAIDIPKLTSPVIDQANIFSAADQKNLEVYSTV